MIAGLIFSELSSSSVFNSTMCEYTVILPDFKIGEIISLVQDVLRLTPGSAVEQDDDEEESFKETQSKPMTENSDNLPPKRCNSNLKKSMKFNKGRVTNYLYYLRNQYEVLLYFLKNIFFFKVRILFYMRCGVSIYL